MTAGLRPGFSSLLIASISAPSFASRVNNSVLLSGKAPLESTNQAFYSIRPSHLPLPLRLCLLISHPLSIVLLPLIPGDDLSSSVCHIRPLPLLCSQKNDAHPNSNVFRRIYQRQQFVLNREYLSYPL